MNGVRLGVPALVILQAIAAARQTPAPFHAETRLVVLPATVTNSRGEFVTDLDQRAFTVEENRKRQTITLFRRDDVPISVGLLIDNSGSMRSLRPYGKTDLGFASTAGYSQPAKAWSRAAYKGGRS